MAGEMAWAPSNRPAAARGAARGCGLWRGWLWALGGADGGRRGPIFLIWKIGVARPRMIRPGKGTSPQQSTFGDAGCVTWGEFMERADERAPRGVRRTL